MSETAAEVDSRPRDDAPHLLVIDDDKRIRMVFRLRMEESGMARWRGKLAAWGALILWFGVALSGRSIGFLG